MLRLSMFYSFPPKIFSTHLVIIINMKLISTMTVEIALANG